MLIDYVKDGRRHSDVNHQLNDNCFTAMNLDRLFYLFNAIYFNFFMRAQLSLCLAIQLLQLNLTLWDRFVSANCVLAKKKCCLKMLSMIQY